MTKDFDSWNNLKKTVNDLSEPPRFHEREIWWCTMGVNVGREQDGKHERFERPILVLKKFNRDTLWALPLTTVPGSSYRYALRGGRYGPDFVLLSQLRLISSRRLTRRMYFLGRGRFSEIIRDLRAILDSCDPVINRNPAGRGSSGGR